ncbi:DUF4365 domain-containing protein [Actinoallomurus oryzae]|uniref:DUF4365 domain-containing protein n=1 Tax=Actinoallomurus oryzae TaxID=502180 RepID=UPI0031E53FD9
MRGARRQQTGNAGESYVKGAFEELGWGVATNPDSDLGTDLFAMARDERLFDLGLVVGVQVKAGESWFSEPEHDSNDGLIGWWFRDHNREHIDAWLRHGLPHLIVLHDLSTRLTYWQHVTNDVVVSTGKGAKILIPAANTLDEAHRNSLLEVAAALRPKTDWEGSAWTGAASVLPRDLLRHALIAPRLVAPHPNAGRVRPLTPEQAVALLAQARILELERFAKAFAEVPPLSEAAESSTWEWRFVAAFAHRVTSGEIVGMLPMIEEAPTTQGRVAATVVYAAGLLQEAKADDALRCLMEAASRDEATPVDDAWLKVHLARALTEVGRVDEARRIAFDVQQIRATHSEDVTATAIAGVAAALLFETAAWRDENLAELITGIDNAVAWWRTQTVSRGLTALVDRTLKTWARDTSVSFGRGETSHNQLVAASLAANHLGDHGAWRNLSTLLGQVDLMTLGRDSEPDSVASRLDALRLAGAENELKLSVKRVTDDGPAVVVTRIAKEVDLATSTQTTARTNLTLLQYGGDVLDEQTANRSLSWLLSTLAASEEFITRTSPSYVVDLRLLDTIAKVAPSASIAARRAIVDRISSLDPQEDQARATSWARIVEALPDQEFDQDAARHIARLAPTHHWALRYPLLRLAAKSDLTVRDQLISEARNGSASALAALDDVRELPETAAAETIGVYAERVRQEILDAHRGQFGHGGEDHGRTLALLNVWHPAVADWETLFQLLEDAAVIGELKRHAFQLLASCVDNISTGIRRRLGTIAITVSEKWSPTSKYKGIAVDAAEPAVELALKLGVLNDDSVTENILRSLAGDIGRRRWAVRIAGLRGNPEDIGLLLSFCFDPDVTVRSTAAAHLAHAVATGKGGAAAAAGLRSCLQDPGTLVPASIAATIEQVPQPGPDVIDILSTLRGHLSYRVRSVVERKLASTMDR